MTRRGGGGPSDGDDDIPKKPSREYKVGKYKPDPKYNWKKGQSGNRAGRPKGAKNLKTIIRASARRLVPVLKGGRKSKLTVMEIGFNNLEAEVVKGSRSAFMDYFTIIERHSDHEETGRSMGDLATEDQAILTYMLARAKRSKKEK